MTMKKIFIDVETTGLDPKQCTIHQLAGIVEIDGEVVDTFNYKVRPLLNASISEAALAVSGVTREQIMLYPPAFDVKKQFDKLLGKHIDKFDKSDKAFFIGYNAKFDFDFMWQWFKNCKDNYFGSYFWSPPIDVWTLAGFLLMPERHKMKNTKLVTVAEALGMDANKDFAHDAMYDIELTWHMWKLLNAKLAPGGNMKDD